jgi:hypothetical protein
MNPKLQVLRNLSFLFGMIAVNAMANALPINGYNTGQVSAFYPNRFVPAGFTFGIWSIIYSLLIGFVVVSTRWLWYQPDSVQGQLARRISPFFIVTCMLNMGWIVAWHYLQVGLSVVIMLGFLFVLIRIYLKLQVWRDMLKPALRLWLYIPFVVYLAWISVATIANITAWLVSHEWTGLGLDPSAWSITMIVIATALGLYFLWKRRETAYALVIAWALFGINSAQSPQYPAIGYAALAGMTALLLSVLLRMLAALKASRQP